jgi:hypothetical protein
MKYKYIISQSSCHFDKLIDYEMIRLREMRQELYRSTYDSVKHDATNKYVIQMKKLMEKGDDTEILKLIPILKNIKKPLDS